MVGKFTLGRAQYQGAGHIGCPAATQCTYVTADGKYFFYISWGSNNWASYWVKADFIEKLRPRD